MARKKPRPYTTMTVSLDGKLFARIDQAAEAMKISRSEWVQMACEDALQQGRDFIKVMSDRVVRDAMFNAFAQPGVVAAIGRAMGETVTASKSQRVLEFFKDAQGVK